MIHSLSLMENLTVNYLGNGFILATVTGKTKLEFISVDKDAWQPGQNYFLVFAEKNKNMSYQEDITNFAEVLYQSDDLLVIRVSDQKLTEIMPPTDGSLTRIWNKEAKFPVETFSLSQIKADPDPFIVARMAEVNLTTIQTNLQHLQDYGTRNAYTAQSVQAQNWIKATIRKLRIKYPVIRFYNA